jgi:hypothetical protein
MYARILSSVLLAGAGVIAQADVDPKRFDGAWDTTVSCPNSSGALGYSFSFGAIVNNGVLHAQKGTKGEPGWLQIDGNIAADGHANLYASGLVGAAEAAVGHRPAGTQYGYHIDAAFTDAQGTGHRVEGRPCSIEFAKSK